MEKPKRPKTTISMKSGGIDNNTLLIVIVIWLVTLLAITNS